MQISQATILELQEIIREDYGREVTFEQASEITRGAITWYDTLARIYHKMKTENENEIYDTGKAEFAALENKNASPVGQGALKENSPMDIVRDDDHGQVSEEYFHSI